MRWTHSLVGIFDFSCSFLQKIFHIERRIRRSADRVRIPSSAKRRIITFSTRHCTESIIIVIGNLACLIHVCDINTHYEFSGKSFVSRCNKTCDREGRRRYFPRSERWRKKKSAVPDVGYYIRPRGPTTCTAGEKCESRLFTKVCPRIKNSAFVSCCRSIYSYISVHIRTT